MSFTYLNIGKRMPICTRNTGRYLVIFLIIFTTTGCFQTRHLSYNASCDLYTYKDVPLRLPSWRLVSHQNIDTFLMQAQTHFLMQQRMRENDLWISPSDQQLVKLYDSLVYCIQDTNYQQALVYVKKLSDSYPGMKYFSDIHFVQGLAYTRLGNRDSAKAALTRFIDYAGQKYPGQFRGWYRSPNAQEQFCRERIAANIFLQNDTLPTVIFQRISPKFYYQSFSPGYGFNRDDFRPNTRWIFAGIGWETIAEQHFFQTSVTYVPHERLGISTGMRLNKNVQMVSIGLPWQIAWAENRRWGIKGTPMIFLTHNKITKHYRLIPATGLSIGYHFHPRYYVGLSIGIPFHVPSEWQPYFETYSWSISANAHLIKNLSATIIFQSHAIVTGITINNTILGYNWQEKQVYLRLQIF